MEIINLFRRKKKEPPKVGERWIMSSHRDDPFLAHSYVVEVERVENGWVLYRHIATHNQSTMKVDEFLWMMERR